MKVQELKFPTSWDAQAMFKKFETEGAATLVVEFPGAQYGTELPLFHYPRKLAFQYGFDVLSLEYGYQSARLKPEFNDESIHNIVSDLEGAFQTIDLSQYKQIVFLSKSLGTLIAGLLAEKLGIAVKHVFLTPLSRTIPYIHENNCLVVTGTDDPVFTEIERNQISSARMLVIDGANHGLETQDPMKALKMLKDVLEEVDQYYKELR
ncbi:hypothetical protein RJP21_23085 [Paenibacillus sp. VCA1]|uniref:hypothetical protein n=1 Tax=Paenibacillus sp. VCA1 TaxID=3039148 RepID=UPI002871ED96|nr:hypothetical protein [Paenibacillus sp. VCA1]MDR9856492.1 hypothetical protein [Paenibacillus sp. VCA1]